MISGPRLGVATPAMASVPTSLHGLIWRLSPGGAGHYPSRRVRCRCPFNEITPASLPHWFREGWDITHPIGG